MILKPIGRRSNVVLAALFFVLLSVGASLMANASDTGAVFYVEAGTPDDSGRFDVTVSAENMEFLVSELAFRYDTSVLAPIDFETGEPTDSFSDFSQAYAYDGLMRIGEKLDAEQGYFLFTMFASVGDETDYVWDKMLHFAQKTELYRFSFRVIGEGDTSLSIASAYDGGVYDPFFPEGAVITSVTEKRPVADVVLHTGGTQKTEKTVTYYHSELYPKNYTKEQRLSGTVYLVTGDYAAAVDGVLAAIDADNRLVVPYQKEETLLLPLRFICESLGCTVDWDNETRSVSVTRPDGAVGTFDTTTGTAVLANEVCTGTAENLFDRTMVDPALAAFLAGARVYDTGEGIIFYTGLPEWTPDREAEIEALNSMKYVLLPFFRMFL